MKNALTFRILTLFDALNLRDFLVRPVATGKAVVVEFFEKSFYFIKMDFLVVNGRGVLYLNIELVRITFRVVLLLLNV